MPLKDHLARKGRRRKDDRLEQLELSLSLLAVKLSRKVRDHLVDVGLEKALDLGDGGRLVHCALFVC